MRLVSGVKGFIHTHSFTQEAYLCLIKQKNRFKRINIKKEIICRLKYPIKNKESHMSLSEARDNLLEYRNKPVGCTALSPNKTPEAECDLQIVIPCYNVEKYIEKCIASILSQKTNFSYHAIFIDDGSTDSTGAILDQYQNEKRFTIFHLKNGGSSAARNAGISILCGKYLMFIDGDDFLFPNAIENLMRPAINNDYDIVEGGYSCIYEGRDAFGFSYKKNHRINAEKLQGYPWGKVYKRSLWKDFKFPLGLRHQDTICSFLIYPLSKRAYAIKDVVYGYIQNLQGVSKTAYKNPATIDTYWITEVLDEDRRELGYKNNKQYYIKLLRQFEMNHNRLIGCPEHIIESVFVLESSMFRSRFSHVRSCKCLGLSLALLFNDYNKYCYYFENIYKPIW